MARFIKLPPVEAKKIPDIVKYEARQQIPFSLDDVVWDYQQLAGGSEEDGFALETEVGLFAMKRDQVARALEPLEDGGHRGRHHPAGAAGGLQLRLLRPARGAEVASRTTRRSRRRRRSCISLGTDTTDLVVTNGFRVWQRQHPDRRQPLHAGADQGAEAHLRQGRAPEAQRHAGRRSRRPCSRRCGRCSAILLAEIQRSLGYFTSLDKRDAKIGEVIALGNAMKLPGLQRYLAQNLEQEVKPIEEFDRLIGRQRAAAPQFKDNILSFAVGVRPVRAGARQARAADQPAARRNRPQRMVRAKKPWAVAAAAVLLAGLAFNYFTHVSSWKDRLIQRSTGLGVGH